MIGRDFRKARTRIGKIGGREKARVGIESSN